jgi:hypothetical protein
MTAGCTKVRVASSEEPSGPTDEYVGPLVGRLGSTVGRVGLTVGGLGSPLGGEVLQLLPATVEPIDLGLGRRKLDVERGHA